ncbi:MAG: DNA polymerase III subunit chi [Deltaproteobacteria bacterium]|nr:DNA polymerase III subunit chi [Deltaproteobacteria bacterium]RLB67523.1 MAG: DNA polymerase III subunit chi [Deltaproteobacteria bacterium]
MTRVEFIKLNRPERARILCDLAEEFYLAGQRVLVMVQDDNQGVTLDKFMWTWKKGAFVPHVYDNGSVECHDEPVVIVAGEENPNGAQVLLMGVQCSLDFIRHFQHVIDFAESFDETRLEESRERFRNYREHGFTPVMRK